VAVETRRYAATYSTVSSVRNLVRRILG